MNTSVSETGMVAETGDSSRGSREWPAAEPNRSARIGIRGVLVILAFWTLYGTVMTGSMLVSPLRQATTAPWELVAFSFLGTYVWAALTIPLFALVPRIGIDARPGARVAVTLVGTALLVALTVSTIVAICASFFVRETLQGALRGAEGIPEMVRYRYLNDLLACSLVLAAGTARDFFLRYRDRQDEASILREQLNQARLEVLRSRLNPHFLFNTLNAVAALVADDPRGVRTMIAGLSELLRFSLSGAAEPEIRLGEELRLTRRYLEIMEIRYKGRLRTHITADPDMMEYLVPNLILQPLVENAMMHGVGQASGHGQVDVTATREGDQLVLTVRDTGGRGARPVQVSGKSGGFGLQNTRDRLRQMYGDGGSLSLNRMAEGGTVAEIRIPARGRVAQAMRPSTREAAVPAHA